MATLSQRVHLWLSGNPEDAVLRLIFRLLIVATIAALGYDLARPPADRDGGDQPDVAPFSLPALPAVLSPWRPDGDRQTPLPQPDGALGQAMTFELVGGGRLMATGTITPGSAEAFGKELARHGEYIKTVVLNSPGGSVSDALSIGRMIRDHKLATEVEAGKYCASSCPLVLFGGAERRVGAKAAVGVHQVFAVKSTEAAAPRDQMGDAQRISARCQRYLRDMGIDLEVWIRAMETPKDRLFVFKPEELTKYGIATAAAPAAKS
ncbi:hypothetical protein DNX69_05740 [Rhodopseudomonas palustris]|uniref:ATP-dependent Clp protease proteolytic subunit n=1 Tax=Rhodopseudomonas palustris TaxID=1076 RepID=A0A323UIW1_RHOPL|nr:ATP-dependent Clp protease proteolytic subunit [Rhodopseudomonas palustris]PZA12972.1 hypothetical protein DNX69_05740 [Rhodopseudomonas palustris]